MKKLFVGLMALVVGLGATIVNAAVSVKEAVFTTVGEATVQYMARTGLLQGFVTLLRPYGGYVSGITVSLPASTEAALIASGNATASAGPVTPGAQTTFLSEGMAAIAIGTSSVVITNPNVTPSSRIGAVVSQAAADATLLRVERVVPAAGSFTIYGTANATAATQVNWWIHSAGQSIPN